MTILKRIKYPKNYIFGVYLHDQRKSTVALFSNKGSKPSFHKAAKPEDAKLLYDKFVSEFKKAFNKVEVGKFGAFMEIYLVNKGPVTFNFKT